jgi:hypothetical protein
MSRTDEFLELLLRVPPDRREEVLALIRNLSQKPTRQSIYNAVTI